MPKRRKAAPKGQYVVLVDDGDDDGAGALEVCCGQQFATQAAALKEAKSHVDSDRYKWIGIAKVIIVGRPAGFAFAYV